MNVYMSTNGYVNCDTGEFYDLWEIDNFPNVTIHNSFDAYLEYTEPRGYGAMELLDIEIASGKKGI